MKTIKIDSLNLSDYKGQSRILTFGNTVTIRGGNGKGKSTIFSSIMWLLTGTDELDRSNFDLFDYNAKFTSEDAVTSEVCAVFDIDGIKLSLKRTAKQKWVQERGSEELVKSPSDEYGYFVDGIKVSKSKYDDTIEANFAPIDKLKLMLNHDYWALLEWRELRNQFMSIVGEISYEDFRGDYSDVIDEIRQKGAEAAKKIYHLLISDKDSGYSIVSNNLRVEIETLKNTLPDLTVCDAADARIIELKEERDAIDKNILGMQGANDHLVAKRKEEEEYIIKKKVDLLKAETEHNNAQESKLRELTNELDNGKRNNRTISQQREIIEKQIHDLEIRKSNAESRLDSLRKENREINARMFDGICPECGSKYEGAKRAEVLQRFTEKKDADRESNIKEGKSTKALIEDLAKSVEKLKNELAEIHTVNVEKLEEAVIEYRKSMCKFDGRDLEEEIARLEESKTEIPDNPKLSEMLIRKSEIDEQIEEQYQITALRNTYKYTKEKIKEKQDVLNSTIQAKADCVRKEVLIQEYINEQSEIIRVRANKFFPEQTEVVMMKRKKDGSFLPTCEIWHRGKNAYGTNTADRREAGRIISEAFQRAYGVIMPSYIDNANDFDSRHTPNYEGQLFLAYVDDCELTITSK